MDMSLIIDETIKLATLDTLLEYKEFWQAMEHRNWRLLNFSGKKKATFGWVVAGQYSQYVTITRAQVLFFRGVEPDVVDLFMDE
jgi:hypothetical protein